MSPKNGAAEPKPAAGDQKTGPQPIPLDQIMAANQKTFAAATRMNAKLMREMLRMQQQMLEFISRRIETDIAAAEALAKCGDGPEVVAVAQEFCAKAMADYADEATELMRLSVEAAAHSGATASGRAA